jgi:hypothetical protein
MTASFSAHRARRKKRSAGLKETDAKNRQIRLAGLNTKNGSDES